MEANYHFDFGLNLNLSYLYLNGSEALSRGSPTRALTLGDFHVVNVAVTQELFDGRVEIIGRVSNLLDQDYVDSFGFPAPGITGFVGVRVRW